MSHSRNFQHFRYTGSHTPNRFPPQATTYRCPMYQEANLTVQIDPNMGVSVDTSFSLQNSSQLAQFGGMGYNLEGSHTVERGQTVFPTESPNLPPASTLLSHNSSKNFYEKEFLYQRLKLSLGLSSV